MAALWVVGIKLCQQFDANFLIFVSSLSSLSTPSKLVITLDQSLPRDDDEDHGIQTTKDTRDFWGPRQLGPACIFGNFDDIFCVLNVAFV